MSLLDSVKLISLCGAIRRKYPGSNPKPYNSYIEMDGIYIKSDGTVFRDVKISDVAAAFYDKHKDELEADAKSHTVTPFLLWFTELLVRIARKYHVAHVFANNYVSMIPSVSIPNVEIKINYYIFATDSLITLKSHTSGGPSIDICEVQPDNPEQEFKKFEDQLTDYLDHNETIAHMTEGSEFIKLANEYIKLLSVGFPGDVRYQIILPNSTNRTAVVEDLKSKILRLKTH